MKSMCSRGCEMEKAIIDIQCGGRGPGHPWYYVLGGAVLPPRAILERTRARNYRGYMSCEIDRIDRMDEPKRSEALRSIKDRVLKDYRADLSIYRQCACELHRTRRECQNDPPECLDIHVSLSLKHNHLWNNLAHLAELDRLLSRQGDLFGF